MSQAARARLLRLLVGAACATGVWPRAVEAGIIRGWFNDFAAFWGPYGGRELRWADWPYLYGAGRERFNAYTAGLPQGPRARGHLRAWQDPAADWLVLHAVYREALQPLRCRHLAPWLPREGMVLEYGAGIGPITWGMQRFFPRARHRVAYVLADIDTAMHRYARHRFRGAPDVGVWTVGPDELPAAIPRTGYSAIVCLETLEHVQRPVKLVASFLAALCHGGVLIYDYVDPAPPGLDTVASRRSRPEVLALIAARTEPVAELPGGVVVVRRPR